MTDIPVISLSQPAFFSGAAREAACGHRKPSQTFYPIETLLERQLAFFKGVSRSGSRLAGKVTREAPASRRG